MSEFSRYAIYYAPPAGPLAEFGASWLGWDAVAGREVAHPEGFEQAHEVTETPRKYGFHGTIKPPFRLAEGCDAGALEAALVALAAELAPVGMDGLRLARLGRFLALVPVGDTGALAELAAQVVQALDRFRALPGAEELARRRAGALTSRQEAMLLRWGYPNVLDEFRFHLTLTGSLETALADQVEAALANALDGMLGAPFRVGELCLFGEDAADRRFRLIRRVALGG